MSISAIMNTAVSGMLAQQNRAAATASNVANASTPGYQRLDRQMAAQPGGGVTTTVSASPDGQVDLAHEMVNLVETSISFKANAAVFETGADLWALLKAVKRD